MVSASFTVNGDTNPAEHIVAYGDVVQLALQSFVGADIIACEIVATSFSGDPIPAVTLTGSPLGATATFTVPADPLDNLGRSFRIKYRVANTVENDTQYAIVGVPNIKAFVPLVPGEELERDRTHGWTQIINRALIAGNVAGPSSMGGDVTGTVTASTVSKINHATVPVAGALTPGNVLQVTGASALGYAPVNLAGGANYVTGLLPGSNVAPTFGATVVASLKVSNLIGPGAVVAAADGTLYVGVGAGASFGTLILADVATLEAFAITGLPDRMPAVVQEFPPGADEFCLVTSGNDGDGNALIVDHVNYLVLATAGAGAAKWIRRRSR